VQVGLRQERQDLGQQRDALPRILGRKPAPSVQAPQLGRGEAAHRACTPGSQPAQVHPGHTEDALPLCGSAALQVRAASSTRLTGPVGGPVQLLAMDYHRHAVGAQLAVGFYVPEALVRRVTVSLLRAVQHSCEALLSGARPTCCKAAENAATVFSGREADSPRCAMSANAALSTCESLIAPSAV